MAMNVIPRTTSKLRITVDGRIGEYPMDAIKGYCFWEDIPMEYEPEKIVTALKTVLRKIDVEMITLDVRDHTGEITESVRYWLRFDGTTRSMFNTDTHKYDEYQPSKLNLTHDIKHLYAATQQLHTERLMQLLQEKSPAATTANRAM
jgi:hypothetical protein